MVKVEWSVWGRSVSYFGTECRSRDVSAVLAALRVQAARGVVFGYVTVGDERVRL